VTLTGSEIVDTGSEEILAHSYKAEEEEKRVLLNKNRYYSFQIVCVKNFKAEEIHIITVTTLLELILYDMDTQYERGNKRKTMFPPIDIKLFPEHSAPAQSLIETEKPFPATLAAQKSPKLRLPRETKRENVPHDLKSANTPQTVEIGSLGQLRHAEPWKSYCPMIHIDEGDDTWGAYSLQDRSVVRLVVRTSARFTNEWINDLLQIRHRHIVSLFEAFQNSDIYLIYDMMYISLDFVIACDLRFREPQIAKICAEVSTFMHVYIISADEVKLLQAICYLKSKSLVHGNVTSSNVVFTKTGETKLGNL
jgi:hypothetical protein